MTKPIKPNITIPEAFAVNGQKADFLDEKIQNGFSNVDPDVLAGDNLNKLIDDTYKGLNYSMDGVSDLYKSVITYDSAETYGLNSIVFNIEEEGVALYQSLIADNTGNALTDEAKWQRLELGGGGAGQPIGSLFWSFAAADYVPDYALACDGTEYSSAMFTGLWNSYLTADVPKLLTKNYTQYQADITEYGNCAAFGVEHSISAVHSGTTITEVAVTMATWENKVTDVGEYVFSYDGTDWSLNSEVVTLADYGVILTGEAASGDTVTVTYAYGTHFKVPKINNTIYQGVTETVPVVGNGKTLGCTGINSSSIAVNFGTTYSAADGFNGRSDAYGANISYKNVSGDVGQLGNIGVTTDGEKSGLVAKLSDNVATITLRCFVVVANKSDNEAEIDWSEWASSLDGKANADLSNCTQPYVTETYVNGTSGYRVWSDGYCVQWGYSGWTLNPSSTTSISLFKNFSNTDYYITIGTNRAETGSSQIEMASIYSKSTGSFVIGSQQYAASEAVAGCWLAMGYLALGQY